MVAQHNYLDNALLKKSTTSAIVEVSYDSTS